jgi:ketosteroid isomerase-like protein
MIADWRDWCRKRRARRRLKKKHSRTIVRAGGCAPVKKFMLMTLLACAGTLAAHTRGDSDSDAAAKLIAMEHLWSQAFVNKDAKALDAILDETFINIDSDGKLQTKAELLAEVKISTTVQFLTDSMVVHLHGDTAIVTGVFLIKGVDRGKPYSQRVRFLDVWFRKNGQWTSMSGLVTKAGP